MPEFQRYCRLKNQALAFNELARLI